MHLYKLIQLIKASYINRKLKFNFNLINKYHKKKSAKTKLKLLFLKFFNSLFYVNRFIIMLNFSVFNFIKKFKYNNKKNINVTNMYFINTNRNALTFKSNKKHIDIKIFNKKQLNKYRRRFVNPYRKYVSKLFKKTCKMIIKFNFSKMFKTWFKRINRIDSSIINFNNIYIYCREITNTIIYFLHSTSSIYFFKLYKLYNFIKYKFKKINNQNFNIINLLYNLNIKIILNKLLNNNNFINFNLILKISKYYTDLINNKHYKKLIQYSFFFQIYNKYIEMLKYFKNKYIKKLCCIFNSYTNYNIIFKNYWSFSFGLKKKKLKLKFIGRKNKLKNKFKKQFNFMYIFNNLINKYIYFIFIYWINLFFSICVTNNIETNNVLCIKKNNLFMVSIYSLYYEKRKYKNTYKRVITPKWSYLPYLNPSRFLLYLNISNKC